VNLKTLSAALACALLVFSMVGCGTSNKLQSITLTVPGGTALQGGVFNLKGDGSTMQLKATGNYSNSKTKDLSHVVTWNLIVDPNYTVDAFNHALPAPGHTIEISTTGLVTAIEPATCTWIDVAPASSANPSWFFVGAYQVTASFGGVISQPIYIPIASSAGNVDDIFPPTQTGNNLSQLCGP
jgi:hypothetical protein